MDRVEAWALVVAAGQGRRLGSALPKQFLSVDGRSILSHALHALLSHPQIQGAVVTLPRGYQRYTREKVLARGRFTKPIRLVTGGASRSESVERGLSALPDSARYVMIHDGVRPCVTAPLISRLLSAVTRDGAVIPGVPVTDTLKELAAGGFVRRTLDRTQVVAAQTPQVFERTLLERAFRQAGSAKATCTDCSEVVARSGQRVRIVDGDPENLKVTHSEDLARVHQILMNQTGERSLPVKRGR